jgi:hypothetical protein
MNLGGLLRRELAERAQECAREHRLPHCLSYGRSPAVCLERDKDLRHGNFLPVTYRTMLRNPNWRRRLQNTRMESGGKLDAQFRRSVDERVLLSRRLSMASLRPPTRFRYFAE